MKPRVLFVVLSAQTGGAEAILAEQVERTVAAGWDATVAGPAAPGLTGLREQATRLGVRYEVAELHEPFTPPAGTRERIKRLWPIREALVFGRALALFGRNQPDVVHINVHFGTRGGPVTLAARLAGLPAVVVFQLAEGCQTANARTRLWWRAGHALGARWVAVSEGNRDLLARAYRVPPGTIAVVRNTVDLDRYRPDPQARERVRRELGAPPCAPVAITLGRLSYQKGHDALASAIEEVDARLGSALFVWAGDGPERAALESRIAASEPLRRRVRILGRRSGIPALVAAADILALPSRYEGLPLALMEGMSGGLACVATAIPGVVEAIEPGRDGLLVPRDDVHALGEALVQLAGSADLRRRLGEGARRRAEELNRTPSWSRMLTLYEELRVARTR